MEERRAALAQRVKKHENMVAMKKRRLDCQRRSEVDERTSDESNDPLVGQSTEETGTDSTTATVEFNETDTDDLLAQHTAYRDKELRKVLKQIEELTSNKEARCNELEGVVTELKIRGKELEIKVTELSKKNVDLEGMNAILIHRILTYEGQFKEQCVQNAGVGKEVEKKVITCIKMFKYG